MSAVRIFTIAAVCLLFSCNIEKAKKKNPEFNFGDILIEQNSALKKAKPTVYKQIVYNGKKSSDTISSIDWESEFDIFWEYDTYKPKWKAILVEKIEENEFGKVIYYKTNYVLDDQNIDLMTVVMDKKNKVQSVKLSTSKSNYFYTTKNELLLQFRPYNEYFMILDEYSVHQTIITKIQSTSVFKMNAKVIL